MKTIISALATGLIVYSALTVHENHLQSKIEKRALELKQKDCYDWQDIEHIVFGEIQE